MGDHLVNLSLSSSCCKQWASRADPAPSRRAPAPLRASRLAPILGRIFKQSSRSYKQSSNTSPITSRSTASVAARFLMLLGP